jgi:hypothetical protein
MDAEVTRGRVRDAREFVMHPAKSGDENQRALQAMIDRAIGSTGEIRVPAIGVYEIAAETKTQDQKSRKRRMP